LNKALCWKGKSWSHGGIEYLLKALAYIQHHPWSEQGIDEAMKPKPLLLERPHVLAQLYQP
jgi:hypothetical protein